MAPPFILTNFLHGHAELSPCLSLWGMGGHRATAPSAVPEPVYRSRYRTIKLGFSLLDQVPSGWSISLRLTIILRLRLRRRGIVIHSLIQVYI